MCGFFGAIGNLNRGLLSTALVTVKRRGTDHYEWDHGREYFFLARLPTDGPPHVEQAFFETQEGLLLWNGILLNSEELGHRFTIDNPVNDTDILLRRYAKTGRSVLSAADGMFAGAFIEKDQVRLFRDPSGIKPCYFAITDNSIFFASTLSALLPLADTIHEVAPGTEVSINKENSRIDVLRFTHKAFCSVAPDDYLLSTIGHSARRYLNFRPRKKIGIMLSGGVDSATVLMALIKSLGCGNALHAFTIGTTVSSDIRGAQELIANLNQMGVPIKWSPIQPLSVDRAMAILPDIVRTIETPNPRDVLVSVLNWPLAEAIRAADIDVVFSGQGFDEADNGYRDEILAAFPRITPSHYAQLIDLYNHSVFPSSLLQRDDRVFAAHCIEVRPVGAFPGFLSSLQSWDQNPEIPKDRIRRLALELGLPEEFAHRAKTRMAIGSGVYVAGAPLEIALSLETRSLIDKTWNEFMHGKILVTNQIPEAEFWHLEMTR